MGIGKSWSSKRFWTELEDGQYELIVQRLNKSRLGVMYIFLWRMLSEPECQVGWQLVIFSVTWLLFQCDRKEHLKENRKRKLFKVIKKNEHVGLRRTNVKSRIVWFLVCLFDFLNKCSTFSDTFLLNWDIYKHSLRSERSGLLFAPLGIVFNSRCSAVTLK